MRHYIRPLIATFILTATSLCASSQLRYGFNLGGSIANASLHNANGYTIDNRSGFRGGLSLEYQMQDCGMAFDVSLLYSRFNMRLQVADSKQKHPIGRNFIDIPLNVKYKFWLPSTNNLAAPVILTGPDFMISLDSRHNPVIKQRRIQPGWNVGAGIDAANILQLTAGYRFGIGNAAHRGNGQHDVSLHTSGWFVSATVLFDF